VNSSNLDSSAGDLFRKAIEASESGKDKLLAEARSSVRQDVKQLLEIDAEAQKESLLNTLQVSASEHGRFVPGTLITSRYRIVSLVGRGGMGEVYRADDLQIGEAVALKFPSWNFRGDQKQAKQFYAEVRSARQVMHPSVCQVYDVGQFDGETFITMEYIDGEDLKSLLQRIGRLTQEKAIEIGSQICIGLAAAHANGVLHRDLKPSNVMIDGKGQARITDFGLAYLAQTEARRSDASGTPAYMAPEQLLRGETSVQSDLYSLGLILFELFTAQYAHPSGSTSDLIKLHKTESGPVRPSDIFEEIDPAVDAAVRRCLDADPGSRPNNAATVAALLTLGKQPYINDLTVSAPSPELVATYGERDVLSPMIAGLTSILAIVGLCGTLLLSGSSRRLSATPLAQPQVLERDARRIIEQFGYSTKQADWAGGFLSQKQNNAEEMGPAFWFRQSPTPLIGTQIPLEARPANYGTVVDLHDPPWTTPGMIALTLDASRERNFSGATLKWFRATPARIRTQDADDAPKIDWPSSFNPEVIGFDLNELQHATWRTTPPDAFDQQFAWEGALPSLEAGSAGRYVYVEAAAFRGRPTYFNVMNEEDFDSETQTLTESSSNDTDTGFGLPISNIMTVLAIAFFARRNWRLRRCDRNGAAKIAMFVFAGQMIGWVCLTSHVFAASEYFLVRDGLKSAIGSAFTAWVVYLALEPFVRKHVPNLLVSWSRLLDGNWTDPSVGRDILFALTVSVWVEVLLALVHSLPGANGLEIPHLALTGWDGVIGLAIGGGANFLTWMLIIFTTCIAIYRFTGQLWLACAFIFLGTGLSAAARDGNLTLSYLYVAVAVLPAIGTVRLGLLFLVSFAIFDYWLQQPITTDINAFYFPTAVFWMTVFVLLTLLTATISLGNRRRTLLS